jgi:thiol-disulfide isomerase/thioredoxin
MWTRIPALAMILLLAAPFYAGSSKAQNSTPELILECELENVAGGRTKSAEIQGKVLVLDFWATWAVPSNAQIPALNLLHETLKGRGVQVTAIASESGTTDNIKAKVNELGVKYPVLIADDNITRTLGVVGFPTTFVLIRETRGWRIVKKYLGAIPDRTDRMLKDIETLLTAK